MPTNPREMKYKRVWAKHQIRNTPWGEHGEIWNKGKVALHRQPTLLDHSWHFRNASRQTRIHIKQQVIRRSESRVSNHSNMNGKNGFAWPAKRKNKHCESGHTQGEGESPA